ncbi:unnamed protein product [Closterium sp. Naga37s-1]|nr:unnamed protein product [Closterium sp. Naga37s-1]
MGLDALVWLKRLELTGCRQLSEAPAGLPPSLETLCLGPFREGSSLVVDISKLSQLRVLKLKCVGVVCGHAAAERLLVLGQQGPIQQLEQEFEGVSLNQLEELEMRLEGMSQEFLLPSNVLPHLRSLLIDAPGIRSLPVNMAAAVPELRQLKLLSWAPEELPRVILELSKLTSLTVHAPQLTSLPEGVSCLSQLRKVELIRCTALQHFPESLTHVQQLVLLQDTSLPSLPAGLAACIASFQPSSSFVFPALPCLACPCLVLPAPALSCLPLPCLACPCLVLPAPALSCLPLPCLACPCLVLPAPALSCLPLPCLACPCLVSPAPALSCLPLPCLACPCLVLPAPALSCLPLPCLACPCLVLPAPALSCLPLPCLACPCLPRLSSPLPLCTPDSTGAQCQDHHSRHCLPLLAVSPLFSFHHPRSPHQRVSPAAQ